MLSRIRLITLVDIGIGNINAVLNMLRRLGLDVCLASSPSEIKDPTRIILPGNGSFDSCIQQLNQSGLSDLLHKYVIHHGVPFMGICVGAQMIGKSSQEGHESGLGWINMDTHRFPPISDMRIPHMGWNTTEPSTWVNKEHPLLSDYESNSRFYFVHSFYLKPASATDVLFTTNYGIQFASAVLCRNILGVQFHPEKSHRYGKNLFASFAKWLP